MAISYLRDTGHVVRVLLRIMTKSLK